MQKYIALLRGINVGGNNIIPMTQLKKAFEQRGFINVLTYINSGNLIFESDIDEEITIKTACEELITDHFGFSIPVGIITNTELAEALANAPAWWNCGADSKHNAIFVIPPLTAAEACAKVGETKPEHEQVSFFGKVIFWSAPLATFSHTRWSKIVRNKAMYNCLTIRNANTTLKLAELAPS
ncbi:MAG: DUF1697 domain-containing protein [Clostridiales bacterium]|nr:DUF1697 domain-containing protein [Clostridiales bacterium]